MGKEKEIQKPLGLIRRELEESIVNTINSSGLPLSMSVYIVKDISDQLNVAAAKQEELEIAEYKQTLLESEKNNKDK